MWENNPEWYQHKAYEYKPSWERMVDYSPDRNRSASLISTTMIGDRLVRLWHVRGVGVMLSNATGNPETGELEFHGLSIYTKQEIGWAPNL